ncbi:hypothetical protein BRAS3843_660059 [Bradyrhizobium sp. STM 3843]|uniref:hypothetical protein n=1 Tax=Bradyrhizobium sp. STM 3843 TaxID=551947 RepID=UPI00024055F5|nr:hypothetical protein [Bradyrhizobium sp. STM 3843]CCE11251.1 hypothetical protein BRAS3843_660059 [Bradyrhizobium sp. STM 3843]
MSMRCPDRQNQFHRKTKFICAFNPITPVQTSREKYSCFYFSEIVVVYRHPASMKRDVRVVTIRGVRGAVAAMASGAFCARRPMLLRTAKPCGPDTPTLVSSR